MNLLTGNVLEEVVSSINGKIRVIRNLGLGTYIQVENLTQSGGIVYQVWKSTLRKIQKSKSKIQNCLILGLGGGSAAKLVRKFWPEAHIIGVDIDPVMVEMGKKYLGLRDVETVIKDAEKFFVSSEREGTKYDLILVDLYVGHKVPEKFQTENYIQLVGSILASSGLAVFNRLYFGEKRREAEKFSEKLEKVFSRVERFFPEANIMFICGV